MDLKEHKQFSKLRLNVLSAEIEKISELRKNDLCIYTTGSYGRLEASENSDIDLFFIDTDSENQTSNIDKTLINAEVIKICRAMNLPEFSKDGIYLSIHKLSDIKSELGSPADDFKNYFTSRLLLLLESQPVYNEELHTKCLEQIIESYYIDFHDHSENFKPIFLVNDIIRFWKTLCLNYEHRRRRKNKIEEFSGNLIKNVTHSKNLKLGFSRKLTCFSFILKLLDFKGTITQEDVLKIAKSTPTERLFSLKENNGEVSNLIQNALDSYQWFIDKTQVPSKEMIEWISDTQNRNEAFAKSRKFGLELFEIMKCVDNQNLMHKLLI